jgi:hypothetical protein
MLRIFVKHFLQLLMKIKLLLILIPAFLVLTKLSAQQELDFGFEKKFGVAVFDSLGNSLPDAWAGGLNACQFNEIDLDNDGLKDLVVFDRNGNRTLTYKNLGVPDQVSYEFRPYLAAQLPHFDDWVIFADYDSDGKTDIFTYSKGYAGIKVYRNFGTTKPEFKLVVYPYLKSFQGSGYVNILVTYADYPAISDIDKDGDLDILSFWGLGSFVELHLNESMETYGTPDSLIFRKTESCWGRFAEGNESNIIYLDTCFQRNDPFINLGNQSNRDDGYRHSGSTFLIFDENDDGLDDLLIGDVDYSSPALLTNGGTPGEVLMSSFTFIFPAYNVPIDIISFPVMNYFDLNNDNKKDLMVSSFDPSLVKSENLNSAWYYKNVSENAQPVFELQTKCLFQDKMLDFGAGAVPVFIDFNKDGLQDLVVGNYGYLDSAFNEQGNLYCIYRSQLALLQNTGSTVVPEFKLADKNFADISSNFPDDDPITAAIPTFGDLDGDFDDDMLVGNSKGTLVWFENVAITGQPAVFVFRDDHFQNIDVGDFSAPQLFDLNADGLSDLAIGKRNGTISYYENTGSHAQPEFTFRTDSLGGVDVRDHNLSVNGYCVPHFVNDKDGKIHLFTGSEFGDIFYYTAIENNLQGKFKLVMNDFLWINEGLRSAIAVSNLNGDQYLEMIVGNYSGGLSYFDGTEPPNAGILESLKDETHFSIFPNPAGDYILVDSPNSQDYRISGIMISDVSQRVVLQVSDDPVFSKQINISNLKNGIYLLKIWFTSSTMNNRQEIHKLLILH